MDPSGRAGRRVTKREVMVSHIRTVQVTEMQPMCPAAFSCLPNQCFTSLAAAPRVHLLPWSLSGLSQLGAGYSLGVPRARVKEEMDSAVCCWHCNETRDEGSFIFHTGRAERQNGFSGCYEELR